MKRNHIDVLTISPSRNYPRFGEENESLVPPSICVHRTYPGLGYRIACGFSVWYLLLVLINLCFSVKVSAFSNQIKELAQEIVCLGNNIRESHEKENNLSNR